METKQTENKAHKEKLSGRKARKKLKNSSSQSSTTKTKNPKAFGFQSIVKARKTFIRSQDIQSKRYHIPLVDHTPLEPPPIIVAVVGGPQVGKTTLIRCLIKNYTRQKLSVITGPVTIVAGKKKRLTFIEVNNDINCMVDIAKIADIVLMIIDATIGIEMEIFEFLEICRAHGSPRIMGVLNHLDMVKDNKALKKKKKALKHRFQVELYPGAKLFYLSGIIHGQYLKNEISNLGRFISVMKFRPLSFRSSHPYALVDRWEDITNSETLRKNPKCDRNIVLYGYVRGVPLLPTQWIHIPGCGDFCLKDINLLPDPCPLPDKLKKRSLNAKERLLYGPMSGVAGVMYDKDAVYIDLGGSHHGRSKAKSSFQADDEENGKYILDPLLDLRKTTDEKREESEFKIFGGTLQDKDESSFANSSNKESPSDVSDSSDEEYTTGGFDAESYDTIPPPKKRFKTDANDEKSNSCQKIKLTHSQEENKIMEKLDNLLQRFKQGEEASSSQINPTDSGISNDEDSSSAEASDEDSSGEEEEDEYLSSNDFDGQSPHAEDSSRLETSDDFRLGVLMDATRKFRNEINSIANIAKFIYGADSCLTWEEKTADLANEEKESNLDDNEMLFTKHSHLSFESKGNSINSKSFKDGIDSSRVNPPKFHNWIESQNKRVLANCFVTGTWNEHEDAEKLLKMDDEDEDLYGDFEDYETGLKASSQDEEEEKEGEVPDEKSKDSKPATKRSVAEKRLEKKRRLKEMFDAEYDDKGDGDDFETTKAEMNQQAQLNQTVFQNLDDETRVQYEGFRAGLYVRMELENIPCEFVQNFDPSYPIVVGGLLDGEQTMALLRLRLKVHRWYPKILKNQDPLIFSLGWRRFQTLTYFAKREDDFRLRSLKYARKYLHIEAVCYAPTSAVSSGFVAFQNISDRAPQFRIAANGVVLGNDQTVNITKKLKLIGYPEEIHTKTAFIKDMFHSDVEVVKFEGTKIQTQSGIRGIVKRPKGNEGHFRATFEDVIKKSDTVILKTWAQVEVKKFYSCVRTLLLAANEKASWRGMRTVSQIKKDENIRNLVNPDTLYTPITERREYYPLPLKIPSKLQNALPYKFKPKVVPKSKAPARVVVVKDPEEVKMDEFMHRLKAMMVDKRTKERREKRLRHKKYKKEIVQKASQRQQREKKTKAQACKKISERKRK